MNLIFKQFSIDIDVDYSSISNHNSIFNKAKPNHNMRYQARSNGVFIINQERILCRVDDEALRIDLEENYKDISAQWFGEAENLNKFKLLLEKKHYIIEDYVPYFCPNDVSDVENDCLCIIEGDDILNYKDCPDFSECFIFDECEPDILGVTYVEKGHVVALAGCNQQGKYTYEIGVGVIPTHCGKHLAELVVQKLIYQLSKKRPDLVGLYSTQFTHINSLRVAQKAGLKLEWVEFTLTKDKDI